MNIVLEKEKQCSLCGVAGYGCYVPLIKYVMLFFYLGKKESWVLKGHVVNNIIQK